MKAFSELFTKLDSTTKTNDKVLALKNYFDIAEDEDKVWAIALLSHKRPRRTVNTRLLREWASDSAGLPHWLFEESYHVVGDLAETMAGLIAAAPRLQGRRVLFWHTGGQPALFGYADDFPGLATST